MIPLLASPACFGWGAEGHRMINRLAAEKLPMDVPEFLRTAAAIEEIEYLGPEPDRWRSAAEPELNSAQAPEHFIDLEIADRIGPLPRRRFDYIAALNATVAAHPDWAKEMRPERVGLQPYVTVEVFERLQAAFREYRALSGQGSSTRPVEAAILFYTGWLGHYVADGSQPLHVTENYDGWIEKANANGYSTAHGVHAQFETAFVLANIHSVDVALLMTPPHVLKDPFAEYLVYLRHSASLVERVYQFDKGEAFAGSGSAESRQFAAERLAAGASELRDLIYTAWLHSAAPVPEYHPTAQAAAAPAKH
ncbi:MAG TPA: S1/P1 nuclease [Acidisarcina sp.]